MARNFGVFCFCLTAAAAPISGIITNGTTGKPQPGVKVTLIQLKEGMMPVGDAVTDSAGRFRFDAPPPAGQLPFLVRADYRGVPYHAPVRPAGGSSEPEVNLAVYDTTSEPSVLRLGAHRVIVEPRAGQLMVAEDYQISNDAAPRKTFVGPARHPETFRFTVAEGQVGDLQVMASGPRSVPLRQRPTQLAGGEYGLDLPLRPGATTVEVNYRLPYDASFNFRKAGAKDAAAETTIIAPIEGVTVTGAGLTPGSRDESQGAQFFRWNSTGPLEFQIAGVMPGPPEGGGAEGGEEVATVVNPTFVFLMRWKILTVLGVALALGLAYLYRLGLAAPAPAARPRATPSQASKAPAGATSRK